MMVWKSHQWFTSEEMAKAMAADSSNNQPKRTKMKEAARDCFLGGEGKERPWQPLRMPVLCILHHGLPPFTELGTHECARNALAFNRVPGLRTRRTAFDPRPHHLNFADGPFGTCEPVSSSDNGEEPASESNHGDAADKYRTVVQSLLGAVSMLRHTQCDRILTAFTGYSWGSISTKKRNAMYRIAMNETGGPHLPRFQAAG